MFLNERDLRVTAERRKDLRREADQQRLANASRLPQAQTIKEDESPMDSHLDAVLAQIVLGTNGERQKVHESRYRRQRRVHRSGSSLCFVSSL